MASITLTRGKTLPDSSYKADFHDLIDLTTATITNITNADISSTAAIAGTKISPDFGSQDIVCGDVTASGDAAVTGTLGVTGETTLADTLNCNADIAMGSSNMVNFSAAQIYDSGWFAISTASTITKTHNLGTTNVIPIFWLSQSSNGSNAYTSFTWSENSVIFGSMLKNLTTTSVTFQGGKDRPAGSMNDSGQDVTYTSGYARIILIALA